LSGDIQPLCRFEKAEARQLRKGGSFHKLEVARIRTHLPINGIRVGRSSCENGI
jgi:hypothetical protein